MRRHGAPLDRLRLQSHESVSGAAGRWLESAAPVTYCFPSGRSRTAAEARNAQVAAEADAEADLDELRENVLKSGEIGRLVANNFKSTIIDIPLAHKDALYVRSHYDTVSAQFNDGPNRDEVVVIWAFATRGRLNARLGGLKASEVKGQDGLV